MFWSRSVRYCWSNIKTWSSKLVKEKFKTCHRLRYSVCGLSLKQVTEKFKTCHRMRYSVCGLSLKQVKEKFKTCHRLRYSVCGLSLKQVKEKFKTCHRLRYSVDYQQGCIYVCTPETFPQAFCWPTYIFVTGLQPQSVPCVCAWTARSTKRSTLQISSFSMCLLLPQFCHLKVTLWPIEK